MCKAIEPIDMLRRCRAHFALEAEKSETAARKAGTVWEANAAREFGTVARRFLSNIDATLRDWA